MERRALRGQGRAAASVGAGPTRRAGPARGESLRYLAIVANNESQFPLAIGLLEQARAVHAANKDVEGESSTLVQLGSVLYNLGRLREARVWLEESLPIFVASGHKYRQAVVRSNLGTILLQEGELGPARQLINEGLEGCLELDDREGVACALGALGDLYRRVGDHQEAQHTLRRSLAIALEIGFDFLASDDVLFLGLDELDSGRVTEAISLLDDSLEHARRAQSPLAETRAQVARTYGFLADGQLEQAQLAANAARAGAQHLDLGALVVEVDVLRARIAALRGGRDEALRLVETAQAQIDSDVLEGSIRPGEMMLACWRILDELGDPRAATALRAGRDFLDDFASRIDDEQLCTGFLRHVPAHVALASAGRVGPV